MKAIKIAEPKKIELVEMEMPVRKQGEALLKMLVGGICGSDLGSYRGANAYVSYPVIPGHELAAEIIEIDDNDKGLLPGMIVTCNPYFNCGKCYSCERGLVNACTDNKTMGVQMDGGFSEYITMPIERIYDGQGLTAKQLALIEPFCISYHGVKQAEVQKGDKVLVVGAGTIGVLAAVAAKVKGAEVTICDIAEEKLNYAFETFELAHKLLNNAKDDFEKKVAEYTDGKGYDVTIEAVGTPQTFQNCLDAVCFGGRMALIGISKRNIDDFFFSIIQKKELHVVGSRNALKEDFIELIELVKTGRIPIEKIVTDVYKLDEVVEAFEEFDANAGKMLKVLIDFQ